MESDVVVIGSGAGGMTAAITAANSGLDVVVLESTPYFGGTTALSGGFLWVPLNAHMAELGLSDSRSETEAYLRAVLGNHYDAAKIDAFLTNAPVMIDYMERTSEVQFGATDIPDYVPGMPGWKSGRSIATLSYDGRKLGADFDKLRRPIAELGMLHSMQVDGIDVFALRGWNKSRANLVHLAKLFGRYMIDRAMGGRGTKLVMGNALAGRLLRSARDAGVKLVAEARATHLLVEGGEVVGVVAMIDGVKTPLRARRGVVLATGGFGANPEMRAKYVKHADAGHSLQPEGNIGDGLKLASEAGAAIVDANRGNVIWAPASAFKRKDGTRALFPSFFFDRHCPGSMMVDMNGRRFVNESTNYHEFGEVAAAAGVKKAWMISDAPAVAKYGIGMVKPWPFRVRPWVKNGYVHEAATIADLACKIGIDPTTLEASVERFNGYAEKGCDDDFGRGGDAYSIYMGDPECSPNAALGALRTGPFYALEILPCDLSTLVGVDTDTNAQVLRSDKTPIAGLYAAGIDNNNLMRGFYPGGGSSLGPAMTFGFIAARHIAAQAGKEPAGTDPASAPGAVASAL